METNVGAEQRRFVTEFATGVWAMTELCERYRIAGPRAISGSRGMRPRVTRVSAIAAAPRTSYHIGCPRRWRSRSWQPASGMAGGPANCSRYSRRGSRRSVAGAEHVQ